MGSVFSSYYAWARRRSPADPEDHCALNVALYGEGGKHWTLTERGRRHVSRRREEFVVGPSAVRWDGRALEFTIDEVTVPLPSRVCGRVRVEPTNLVASQFDLDEAGRHHWRPIGACAHAQVELERPSLAWKGRAYFDTNWGSEPLEAAFAQWHWSRGKLADGSTAVLYDVERRAGPPLSLALRIDASGAVEPFEPPPLRDLPGTLWRVPRRTRADDHGAPLEVKATFEDAPFYARSHVGSSLLGESIDLVHESLSLDRFARPWVQVLLPFRMPRRS